MAETFLKIKEQFPDCKIIAVDIAGSQILGRSRSKKHISGIGTGFVPQNLTYAKYDDYMIIEEAVAISECNNLFARGIVVGASSGAVAYAIQGYMGYSKDLETKKQLDIVRIEGKDT